MYTCQQSYTSKSIGRQGIGSFCKDFLRFSTVPCRPMPLLVHFDIGRAKKGGVSNPAV